MTSLATPVRLVLRTSQEVSLVRALLDRHVRKSMEPGMNAASATVARRILRRLNQQSPPQPPSQARDGLQPKGA